MYFVAKSLCGVTSAYHIYVIHFDVSLRPFDVKLMVFFVF